MTTVSPIQEQYDAAMADPAWTAKLMSGDAGARAAFDSMTRSLLGLAPDPPPSGAAIELTGPNTGTFDPLAPDAHQKMGHDPENEAALAFVEGMRERGANDTLIREALDGSRTYTAELREYAQEYWDQLCGDPKFRQALLNGDAAAARKWRGYCVIASGGVKAA
jgi:hypothetical protein